MRNQFLIGCFLSTALNLLFFYYWKPGLYSLIVILPLMVFGFVDFFQTRQAIRRNFPILGNFRYWFEAIRPEINQYFVESNSDGVPFSREQRSVVYQRAKKVLDTLPFGTQKNVYETGHEFVVHSLAPSDFHEDKMRTLVGGPDCKQPYDCSLFNISAMSYGSLSSNAVLALNGGAKDGNFAHNTGEGGISPYHKEHGGDLIWQIGTGYFGCRNEEGGFDAEKFKERAALKQVKMIEIKLSQGAKPGHGGILPAEKLTAEIASIRGVPMGKDVNSPPAHSAFNSPSSMMHFIKQLRELSDGKPIGFKLSVGYRYQFIALCKSMIETGIKPDFIVVDGSEGGTGAAPIEFSNNIGTPGVDALVFVNNVLMGMGLRDDIKIISTGKVISGFGIVKQLCLGADIIYAARSFMLALGCIQALRCNSNHCPAGVATQDASLVAGLVVSDKRTRVYNFHDETIKSAAHILGAMGVYDLSVLNPRYIKRRVSDHVIETYGDFFPFVERGDFLKGKIPSEYARHFHKADPDSFTAKVINGVKAS